MTDARKDSALAHVQADYWQDRAEGLEADLREAVRVAYSRGATEWARLNYPKWIEWLEASVPHKTGD